MTRMVRSPGSCWVWGAGESEERRSGGQMEAGERNPDTCGQAERLTSSALAQVCLQLTLTPQLAFDLLTDCWKMRRRVDQG